MTPLLRFNNFLKQLTELRKNFILVYLFTIKDAINNQVKGYIGWGPEGPQAQELMSLWSGIHHHLGTWMYSAVQKLIIALLSRAFISSLLFFLEVSRWVWNFQPFNHLVFLVTSPILRLSRGPILNHLISINSGMFKSESLWKTSKGIRSCMLWSAWDKEQIHFLLYHMMI